MLSALLGALVAGGLLWAGEWLHFRYSAARARRRREVRG